MLEKQKIIVALDTNNRGSLEEILKKIKGSSCRVKVGKELFTSLGHEAINLIQKYNFEIFLDLKFHDIPSTVEKACKAAAEMGIWMLNVHASGGKEMLNAAKNGVMTKSHNAKLIAVTILTSFNENNFNELNYKTTLNEQILSLAKDAANSGLDGVVCSAKDISKINNELPKNFIYVTPGIRGIYDKSNDQKRTLSPKEAIKNGSNYLVIGRPITESKDPKRLIEEINTEINSI
jgi:orotidine-5'-phosphate decarboxylase